MTLSDCTRRIHAPRIRTSTLLSTHCLALLNDPMAFCLLEPHETDRIFSLVFLNPLFPDRYLYYLCLALDLYYFVGAAITKYPGLGSWHWTCIFSEFWEARSLRSRCQEGCFLQRPLSLACRWLSAPCVFTCSSSWTCLCPNCHFLLGC